jgi:hypothetical protein
MPNSLEMRPNAGATIDDEKGEMNMKIETKIVVPQRLPVDHSKGFSGSEGSVHVT